LHTSDLEEARRLMQAEAAKTPLEAELASLKVMVAQPLQAKQADAPIQTDAPLVQTNGTNGNNANSKSLSEIFNQYMELAGMEELTDAGTAGQSLKESGVTRYGGRPPALMDSGTR
jgi:endonuclease/exonuclease/phosphatase (EEP) superfamily protein YafD